MIQGVLRAAVLAVLLAVLIVSGSSSLAQASPSKEALSAARMLRSWQFEDARRVIKKLVSKAPTSEVSRYLQAELDFFDGRYSQVIAGLEALEDGDIDGNVGPLRDLAISSYSVTKDFVAKTSPGGHFKIFYAPGKDEAIVDLTAEVLDAAYEALGKDLGHRPNSVIRVELLGAPSQLAQVSTLTTSEIETTGTIALCKYGKLMVVSPRATLFGYPWMDTLTHEYVHFVVTQMSHDTVPVWLHEGLARYLQVRWRGPATGRLSTRDQVSLSKALKKKTLVSFDDMHPSMAKLPSQEAAALAFAEVHTMLSFVHQKVGDAGLRAVILDIKGGSSARKAVASVMNKDWKAIEASWIKHLKSSGLQSKGLAGHGKTIRFRKGQSSDDNVGVEHIKNEKARKFTRLAGMLRAHGNSAAAALEYEKAMAFAGPGDLLIGAKLSRVYLELGRLTEAIALAEPLLDLDEMDPLPPTTLGAARLASGDHQGAVQAFTRALRINPFDTRVRCGLAQSYQALADKRAEREREACQLLQQVR